MGSRFTSRISITSWVAPERRGTDMISMFPKKLPEISVGPLYDESGFSLNERIALRKAWALIKPYERRYGKEIFYAFLMKNYKAFESFRIGGRIDLVRLHKHSLWFMRFIGSLIEQRDAVALQILLTDNNTLHRRANVTAEYMELYLTALIDYVLDKLQDVCSASLESGFRRLFNKFRTTMIDAEKNKNISFFASRSSQINQVP